MKYLEHHNQITYSQSEKGLVFNFRLWVCFLCLFATLLIIRAYFSYFFCLLYIAYTCTYGCIQSIVGTCQVYGSAGKFYFLSLLVKQLGAWIGCVFRGNHKVHRANKGLKQLRFAFLSYLSVFLQL